jgi:hypothetical protein
MNPTAKKVYLYANSWKTLILAILFFSAVAVGLAFVAARNTGGLRVFRLFTLSPQGATRFYVVLSAIGGVLTLTGIFGVWRRLARPQTITMDDEGLEVPKSFLSRDNVRVLFSEISQAHVTQVTGDRFLKLEVRGGTRHGITQSLLPSKAAFDEIHAAILERAPL